MIGPTNKMLPINYTPWNAKTQSNKTNFYWVINNNEFCCFIGVDGCVSWGFNWAVELIDMIGILHWLKHFTLITEIELTCCSIYIIRIINNLI